MTPNTPRPAPGALRVVLADDHPVVRDGLAALLQLTTDIDVVATVADGRSAVREAITLRPDVLVMDIQMPVINGVQATAEITRLAPDVAILMLTMFDDNDSVFAAMRAGAAGYVLKGAEQEQIIRAIRAVADGEAIFGPGVAHQVRRYLTGAGRADPAFPQLTDREREILDLLAGGLTNTAISHQLNLATKTISNHISSIFAKLQVTSRTEAAVQARTAGLGTPKGTSPPG